MNSKPPGVVLQDLLYLADMTQAELGRRLNRPLKTINEIVKGKTAITPETASQLERTFGVPAEWWLYGQANQQLSALRRNGGRPSPPRRLDRALAALPPEER